MINIYLGAVLVTVPFFIKAAQQTSADLSQQFLFAVAAMLGVLVFGIRKTHDNLNIAAIVVFIIAFMAKEPFGVFQYYQLGMVFAGLAFIALVYSQKQNINQEILGKHLAIVCIVESLWVVLNYLGVDPFAYWFNLTIPGTSLRSAMGIGGSLGNINHSGALIAGTMPFLAPWFWPLPIIALFIGKSTMPVICALAGAITLVSYRNRKYIALKLGAALLFVAAVTVWVGNLPRSSFFSDNGRVRAWKMVLGQVGVQFSGKGLGWVPSVFAHHGSVTGEKFYQLHNEWLELYVIGGLLSVVIGVFFIIPAFKNKGNPAVNACLIALLVNSLGNFTFHIAPLFMVFGTCYALQLSEGVD